MVAEKYKQWKNMTEDERKVARENREKKLAATTEMLVNGIKGVMNSDQWKNFLLFSAKFYRYSFRNMLLIWIQKPTATLVGSFKFWLKMHRMPRKGTGLQILVPIIKKVDIEDSDGNTYQADRCVGFKIGHVFDIGDTDPHGEPIKGVETGGISLLQGNEIELYTALQLYAKDVMNIPTIETNEFRNMAVNGSCRFDAETKLPVEIKIKADNEPTMKAKTMAHEITHATLHKIDIYKVHTDKSIEELEAESAAFIVMHNFGIDSGEYSFMYLATWAGNEEGLKIIQQSGKRIQETARDIITWIEEKYGIVADIESETEEKSDE